MGPACDMQRSVEWQKLSNQISKSVRVHTPLLTQARTHTSCVHRKRCLIFLLVQRLIVTGIAYNMSAASGYCRWSEYLSEQKKSNETK